MLWLYRGGGWKEPECGAAVYECGAVVGVIQIEILRGLLGLDAAKVISPASREADTFPGFSEIVDLHLPSLRESGGG